ncbi:LRR receptor-like serine/threonine-protein kinase EFR [Prunus yedoensis var. nudiflora]|uniref:LRR receptor-like serine/threonine-protein kinase EFR n=1 Tax=Prunus yedoensis var. nudiflora TaxID=2094558 RepID=A0A314Y5H3_PRUYE|nr:LRR receptor-like serine/threonine-protein kinase EFR [Prunus yedoensis var. nudiflora]
MSGSIPIGIGNLSSLVSIYLGYNELSGSIPTSLGRLGNLQALVLNDNKLRGYIPYQLCQLDNLTYLYLGVDLSNNHLSGVIPSTIGSLRDLATLSLANNNLQGPVPSSFHNLLSLSLSDLSRNNVSGVIPKSFEALSLLKYLELSFNKIQGQIPTGGPSKTSPLNHLCQTMNSVVHPDFMKRNVEVPSEATSLSQRLLWRRVSQLELVRVTNGFNKNNLLGSRGFGSVYRGTLSDGTDVAVKVFSLPGAFKSFDKECEMLSNIRHRDLIKIINCCSEIDFKALVLNYIPNESLEKWLYSENSSLGILERMNIMIDVASTLEYLHHGGGDSTTESMTLATIGYMAPDDALAS